MRPLSLSLDDLDGDDELVATLDCTGGFYSEQRWRGVALGRLFDRADARPERNTSASSPSPAIGGASRSTTPAR